MPGQPADGSVVAGAPQAGARLAEPAAACLAAARAALDTFAPAVAVDSWGSRPASGVDPAVVGCSVAEVGLLLGTALHLTGDTPGAPALVASRPGGIAARCLRWSEAAAATPGRGRRR
jgi:hypothetical protein